MVKASPARTSFNAGVFSTLVEGRTDYERYPASMRSLVNALVTPQGPCTKRSGTRMVVPVYDESLESKLVPYVYNEDQALWLEFADKRLRFMLETGIQTYSAANVTNILQAAPLKITSATLNADIGDQVLIYGLPVELAFNGVTLKIVAKAGNDYTFDLDYPGLTGVPVGVTVRRVYHIDTPYEEYDVSRIRTLNLQEVVYVFCKGYRPAKLSRYGDYDWRFSYVEYTNGPFMPAVKRHGRLTLNGTGNAVPVMTSDSTPSGVASASSSLAGTFPYFAFDANMASAWTCNVKQKGWLEYEFDGPVVVDGYTIYRPKESDSDDYSAIDYAPGSWTFEAHDGSGWIALDQQTDYVLYENGRSVFFEVNNTVAYTRYRLNISECTRNGPINPKVARFVMRAADDATNTVGITLSGDYTAFNGGAGFELTDVDRLLRMKGVDGYWRVARITSVTDATHVNARILAEPFTDVTSPILEWQIGYWSDTTGWPTCGAFFDDRVWLSGSDRAPGLLAGSRVGAYEDFAQRNQLNEVLDDSAVVAQLNSSKVSRVLWMSADERGLLIGTGTSEWVITSSSTADSAITARSIKARTSTERGSSNVEPVKIDRQVLFVPRSRRLVREMAYVYEADGYRSPSMSLFASHLGVKRFSGMAYQAEPYSVVWVRRDDGSLVGLTYNREQDVIGWHNHDIAGGFIRDVAVIPSIDARQDTLGLIIERVINGVTRRYIEILTQLWDFEDTVEAATFLDCSMRYEGPETDTVYNAWHLEGRSVDALIDGIPARDLTVTDGRVVLPIAGENIVIGLRISLQGEISRIEAGATDGTAQGKTKRVYEVVPSLWDSAGGEIGVYNDDREEFEYTEIVYPERFDIHEPVRLQTCMIGPITLPMGHGKRGTIAFRQDDPLPFNLLALYPKLNTQDG